MSEQKPDRKRRENRSTDPFGGPAKRGNTVSITVILVALAFFLVRQWTNGDQGNVAQDTIAIATVSISTVSIAPVATPVDTSQLTVTETVTGEDEAPVAQATVTIHPTQASAAANASQVRAVQTPRATIQPTPTANAPPVERASDLPILAYDELPSEAQETVALIDQGGPFPYDRDGVTFENRERLLPREAAGYYREYTVITPGASNRGARRIVTGDRGEMYYTDDHYDSFSEITR